MAMSTHAGVYARAVPSEGEVNGRPRQARSVANDERVLDAALHLADEEGWRGLSVTQVADTAGVSRTVVLTRFKDRSAIGAGLWTQSLATRLRSALSILITACSQADQALTAQALSQALEPFARPDRHMRAAAELLLVGRYEPTVALAIEATLAQDVARWLETGRGTRGRSQAAVRAFSCSIALGLLVEARRQPLDHLDLDPEFAKLAAAFAHPAPPAELPKAHARHLDRVDNFDTGNPDLNSLLRATLEEVAAHGYEAATIDQIVRLTTRSTGFLFSRYSNKRELFLDAQAKYSERAALLNEKFIREVATTHGLGIADAVATRELMRPERRQVMTVALEMYRLAWHDPEILATVDAGFEEIFALYRDQMPDRTPPQIEAALVIELARGNGPLILAGLSDTAWKLPFDVVTRPLLDESSTA